MIACTADLEISSEIQSISYVDLVFNYFCKNTENRSEANRSDPGTGYSLQVISQLNYQLLAQCSSFLSVLQMNSFSCFQIRL